MKRIWKILAVLAVLLACCSFAISESSGQPRLTIMIYMCGSNLESSSGAASADVEEMKFADFDPEQVSLLVMAGGTKEWDMGLDPDKVSILEIAPGRQKTVWKSEKLLDMSDGETLSSFIRFCADRYPADDYALILWDHGGGPLEGVCWDELFSMNHMSYPKLVSAIRDARLGQKLSWIGFDACLMSSMEVAAGLSDVAEYMIASQETEPSAGWNYSFLDGIEEDESPAETGKRIVDAYFEDQEDSHDILTLACIDLSKVADAAAALGAYFEEIDQGMSAASFPELSNLRMSSAAFGKGVRSIEGDSGYDLVDARDLVEHMEQDPEAKEKLLTLLNECIIYSRSNTEQACGLTIYHPYYNKSKYLSGWKKSYEAMNLIEGYTDYVHSFGTLLTGAELVRWTDLYTKAEGRNDDGELDFSVQLTEEQAAHFASAQLLIVRDTGRTVALGEGVAIVSASQATLGTDGVVRAAYDESMLFVERGDGSFIGPLSYIQTDDGQFDVVMTAYIPEGEYSFENAGTVLYYLASSDRSRYPEIYRTRIWDDATQSYSSRLTLDESKYRMIAFWNRNKSYPGPRNGVLPEFNLWKSGSYISMLQVVLPETWRFTRLEEQQTGAQLYAMFQIVDAQQNIYCSVPVPVDNPNLIPFGSASGEQETLNARLSLTGVIDKSEGQPSVRLMLSVENTGAEGEFHIDDILLNGSRETNTYSGYVTIGANETHSFEIVIDAADTAYLEEIQEVSFILTKTTGDEERESAELHFEPEGCDLSVLPRINSLGKGEQDQITMDLLDISPNDDVGFRFIILVDNQGQEEIHPEQVLVDGLELEGNNFTAVGPGHSRVLQYDWQDGLSLQNGQLSDPESEEVLYRTYIVTDLLAHHDYSEISEIGLTFSNGDFWLPEWWYVHTALTEAAPAVKNDNPGAGYVMYPVYFPEEAGKRVSPAVIVETGRYQISLQRMILGGAEVVLVMEATNKTDQFIKLLAEDMFVNGSDIGTMFPSVDSMSNDVMVAPGATVLFTARINEFDGVTNDMQIGNVSIVLHAEDEQASSPVVITLKDPASTGKITWIDPEQTGV